MSTERNVDTPGTYVDVVGIGASAGGLEALESFLRALPADTGLAYVVVQHLDPNHESRLVEILARSTPLAVEQAIDGAALLPDHIYVIPPNAVVTVAADTLVLKARDLNDLPLPVDDLFLSLAAQRGAAAVGVILSGSGSDGARGIEAIGAAGGMTFAQLRATAKFEGMPAAAIESGVDHVLAPDEIAVEIARVAKGIARSDQEPAASESAADYQDVLAILRRVRAVNFAAYKTPTVRRRIARRMAKCGIESLREYVAFVKAVPAEVDALIEDILIKVTCFFRNAASFAALKEHVIPRLVAGRASPIRIWVAGCATGEEAYSFAIAFLEYFEEHHLPIRLEIFATDVSETALSTARQGRYDDGIAADVSAARLAAYFIRDGNGYRVKPAVRECCIFARQDLAIDPPFSRMDIVSCRNVLIYLSPATQKRILSTFHFALNPGGFLTLGNAETVGMQSAVFAVVDKTFKIFVKSATALAPSPPDFIPQVLRRGTPETETLGLRGSPPQRRFDLLAEANRVVDAALVPSGVVVNEQLDVVQFRGDTDRFLMHPPGDITANLLKMCRPGIGIEVRKVVHQAAVSNDRVLRTFVLSEEGRGTVDMTVDVHPFADTASSQRYFVVLFSERPRESLPPVVTPPEGAAELDRLVAELADTKEYLSAIIEKEQAANEELKSASEEILSANEELQSTNEEMATTKEETQAANEELTTVNDELQSRNRELGQTNNDLANFFDSVNVPMVMLSDRLELRRITPAAEKALNLDETDRGRTFAEIDGRLRIHGLHALAADVLATLNSREYEVEDVDGHWFSLRLRPYRTDENKIDGVVLALVDIDHLKKGLERLKASHEYADAIVQTAPVPLLVLDDRHRVVSANRAFFRAFQVKEADTKGVRIYDLGNGQWQVPRLRHLLEEILPHDGTLDDFVVDHDFPGIGRRTIRISGRRLTRPGGLRARIVLAFNDLTTEKRVEEALSAAREAAESASKAKSDFLANMSHEIRTPLGAIQGFAEILYDPNRSRDEIVQSASRITKNVEHLLGVIDELLDLAKIEAGKLEVDLVKVELLPELAETFAALEVRARARGLAFEIAFDGEIPEFVVTCPKRFRQILLNVVGNAVKFTTRGGVYVKVGLSPPDETSLRSLCIEVADTGCGVPSELQHRLFEPFGQADSSITRKFGGTGLGLILARRLAHALGGDVALRASDADRGSTFVISIAPGSLDGVRMLTGLSKAGLVASREPVSTFRSSAKLAGFTVLLVEDGPDNQALMGHFLSKSGAKVDVASDGAEAIAKALSGQYDIVLMDIQMPILGGYEATERLTKAGYTVPIVALTAHAMRGERERCLAAGCVDYLSKPVNPTALVDLVARIAKRK